MNKKNKVILFTTLLVILITSIVAALIWALDWYWLDPAWLVVLQTLGLLIFITLLSLGFYRMLTRKKVNEDEKRTEEWRQQEIKNNLQTVWRKHSKLSRNPYSVPWYVYLTEDSSKDPTSLQQMGFEAIDQTQDLPKGLVAVKFWASDSAIVVTIDLNAGKETLNRSLEILLQAMQKHRARQVFNAALCSVSLGKLLESSEISVSELSQKYRSMLEEINRATGLTLPVYCLFTDMAQVKDLCELFSPLDENERELPFGALKDATESKFYEKVWFEASFDKIIAELSSTLSLSLKRQLNSDYRDSAVSGLFQLSALRYDLEDFLSLTFNQHQFDETELYFRGYFFLNAGGDSSTLDLVSAMHASELGFESISTIESQSKTLSLFTKGLFPQCILKEADLVGVNKKREFTYRVSRLAMMAISVGLIIGFVSTLRAGFHYQQALDNKALAKLEQYKENLETNKIQPDDLASPVFSLYELREINELYTGTEHPWYASRWLPNSSIAQYVHQAYFTELTSEMLTLMRDYIMKDMFVYNSLDDKVRTLELLNLQQILYNPNRHSSEPLINYYISALNEEGSGSSRLIQRFKLLAQDALNTGAVPPKFDEQLLKLVRSSLSSNDVSELLYQHIMQHKDFLRRVDIREQLNPSYKQLYTFKPGFSGYLIPYAFTRYGFEELSNETGFQLASEAIKAYEGVMGRISGDAEMSRINRQLRERYIKDYIQHWSALVSSVSVVEVNSWGGSEQQLNLATDVNFSPLYQFFALIDENTNLAKSLEHEEPEQDKEENSAPDPVAEPSNIAALERVADSITYPFSHIHSVIENNKTGQSPYGVAVAQLTALREWIAKSKEIEHKGHFYLEQLKNTDQSNPIAQLNMLADDFNVPLLPELMQQQATLVNGLALDSVREVINQDWSKVSDFYQSRLASNYPFNVQANSDASLNDVELFFKPNGEFDQFVKKYDSRLEITSDRELFITGFIPHQYLSLSWMYQPFKDSVAQIQQHLFTGDKLGFSFSVKAVDMSPVLTRFALTSDAKLFEYRNGPKLWRNQTWPIPSNQSQEISILIEDTSGVVSRDKQSGVWSWFRVADNMQGATQVNSDEVMWRYQVGEEQVNLLIRSSGAGQPLDSSYFKTLNIPLWL